MLDANPLTILVTAELSALLSEEPRPLAMALTAGSVARPSRSVVRPFTVVAAAVPIEVAKLVMLLVREDKILVSGPRRAVASEEATSLTIY